MSHTASEEFRATHPLGGIESWPKTGPVYGLTDDDEDAPRVANFWERIGERFRRSPPGDSSNPGQARIWY